MYRCVLRIELNESTVYSASISRTHGHRALLRRYGTTIVLREPSMNGYNAGCVDCELSRGQRVAPEHCCAELPFASRSRKIINFNNRPQTASIHRATREFETCTTRFLDTTDRRWSLVLNNHSSVVFLDGPVSSRYLVMKSAHEKFACRGIRGKKERAEGGSRASRSPRQRFNSSADCRQRAA